MVGEFGVFRDAPGAAQYLTDVIEIFDEYSWHWAFYSFREDNWARMDYELGSKKAPYHYWQSIEKKILPNYGLIRDSSLVEPIKKSLTSESKLTPLPKG